jgi:hypothetical protein
MRADRYQVLQGPCGKGLTDSDWQSMEGDGQTFNIRTIAVRRFSLVYFF